MISTRYGKANNKYMTQDRDGEEYDPSKPSTFIPYLDANNLYGWAMSRKLPTDGFQWMTPWQLKNWMYHTCIVLPSGIYTDVNKMVIGMFKDEVGGKIIVKFVGLRAKNYAYVCEEKEYKKCKGIKKSVTEKDISCKDYEDCLFHDVQIRKKMNTLQSHLHDVFSKEINKVALCARDDKRVVLQDGNPASSSF